MRFIDEVSLHLKAGHGGQGSVSFRREKYVPKGGPDGGDGGRGGDIVFLTDERMASLLDFAYKHTFKAPAGQPGGNSNKTGKSGKNLVLKVPVGTIIYNADTNEIITDLDHKDAEFVVAKGGKGGQGNARFTRPSLRTPDWAQQGLPGEETNVRLELKMVADVGVIGLPNAGKSTLVNAISAAKAKVGDYPFTTLVPNLGVVRVDEERSFVVADVPGLIAGASEGLGLGIRFLKHIQRTRCLVHLVDVSQDKDPVEAVKMIEDELRKYDPGLLARPRIIAASKIDAIYDRESVQQLKTYAKSNGLAFTILSSATHKGLKPLVSALAKILFALDQADI